MLRWARKDKSDNIWPHVAAAEAINRTAFPLSAIAPAHCNNRLITSDTHMVVKGLI